MGNRCLCAKTKCSLIMMIFTGIIILYYNVILACKFVPYWIRNIELPWMFYLCSEFNTCQKLSRRSNENSKEQWELIAFRKFSGVQNKIWAHRFLSIGSREHAAAGQVRTRTRRELPCEQADPRGPWLPGAPFCNQLGTDALGPTHLQIVVRSILLYT